MCERSRKASITGLKMRGYTSKQTRATEVWIQEKKTRVDEKTRTECANGRINKVMADGTNSTAQHSAAVPLVV